MCACVGHACAMLGLYMYWFSYMLPVNYCVGEVSPIEIRFIHVTASSSPQAAHLKLLRNGRLPPKNHEKRTALENTERPGGIFSKSHGHGQETRWAGYIRCVIAKYCEIKPDRAVGAGVKYEH